MENFDLRKYLAEGKLLKEEYNLPDSDSTTDQYVNNHWDGILKDILRAHTDLRNSKGGESILEKPSQLDIDIVLGRFDGADEFMDVDPNVYDEYFDFYDMYLVTQRDEENTKDISVEDYPEGDYSGYTKRDDLPKLDEGVIKEELTWYVEDENEDVRFQNDEYLKEVGRKIKEIHPDISSEDLNKIIIMTGEQYSREEDFHGDSIPSGNFVDAAVEIYQTDVLGSDGEDDKDFDRWAPENLDGDFPKDSIFAGWTQAQYDAYQEEPRKYEKYLGGGSFELS